MTKTKSRKAKNKNDLSKQFMLSAAKVIAQQIVNKKVSNNGRAPWGYAASLLKQGREIYPKMSMRTINNYIKRLESGGSISGKTILVDSSSSNQLSSLSISTSIPSSASANEDKTTTTTTSNSSNESIESENENENIANPRSQLLGGRPKGTTSLAVLDERKRYEEATREAVKEFQKIKDQVRSKKKRLPKGSLTEIISNCMDKYDLHSTDYSINAKSIRQRLLRKTKSHTHGPKSPLSEIEPYIVSLILQLADMRVPLTTNQGLQLCNSIIQGTKYEKYVEDFKENNLRTVTKELGPGYWRGFMKRNKHLISSKRAVRFDTKRAEWCTYQNLKEMYDEVYTSLVSSGLAVKHDEALLRNASGEVVSCEKDAAGLESMYELIHPEWLIFVDEVGSNTSQAKDGAVGGQTYLCSKTGRPQQRAATKDAHFTVLGFTAASGEPLMCAIIFSGKTMKEEWRLGFDPFAEWIGEENDVNANMGEGKSMPLGPECKYNGVNLPCFCCCSENGSITGGLLTQMLKAIDDLNVFDRSIGLNPFLLLDGHGSRFELEYLEYINRPESKWNCCIGLPYGTSYWQVGDSSEQNGSFKMALTRAKQELVTEKNDSGLEFAINKTDIVGLVSKAWKLSFARVNNNQKAVASRGWGPRALAYNALLHPEILTSKYGATTTEGQKVSTDVDPEQLNFTGGIAGTLVDRIVLYKNREARLNGSDADEIRRKRKATAEEKINAQEKRLSAGILAAAGRYQLDSNVRDYVKAKAMAVVEKERERYYKKKDEYDVLYAKVQEIRSLNLPCEKWTQSQLKVMLRWYKRPDDPKLPTKKQDQLLRYQEISSRGDMRPPQPPDNFLPLPPLPEVNLDNLGPVPPERDDGIEAVEVDTCEEELGPVNSLSDGGEDSDELEVARILLGASATSSV